MKRHIFKLLKEHAQRDEKEKKSDNLSKNIINMIDPVKQCKRSPEFPADLEDIILEYVDSTDETFSSKSYVPKNINNNFFDKRLPVFTLLQHAVRGEYTEVNAMLTKNPFLLLEKGTVSDYSGRKHYKRTVYQIALGACDYNIVDKNNNIVQQGMVEMIEDHFFKLRRKIPIDIYHIKHAQYIGQFPEFDEANQAYKIAADSKILTNIITNIGKASHEECALINSIEDNIYKIIGEEKNLQAIELKKIVQTLVNTDSKGIFKKSFQKLSEYLISHNLINNNSFNFHLLEMIYQFRNHFKPKKHQIFGKHFHYELLSFAVEGYVKHYEQFGNEWDSPKNILHWQKILGYIQRLVPACDAQIITQGLFYILEKGEKSRRSLDYGIDPLSLNYGIVPYKYFPLRYSNCEIGYNCAGGHRGGGAGGSWRVGTWMELLPNFQSLCQQRIISSDVKRYEYQEYLKYTHRTSALV